MSEVAVMVLMVTGSRDWPQDQWPIIYNALSELLLRAQNRGEGFSLLHGAAKGADEIAGDWADDNEILHDLEEFRPDYDAHGKRAPHVRNDEMLRLADYVVAFWDGKSRGTKSVIRKAQKLGIAYEVHSPKGVYVEV
jgi:hypothetical protein